jgi:hypothetical protein
MHLLILALVIVAVIAFFLVTLDVAARINLLGLGLLALALAKLIPMLTSG